jgi:hypothetical protein
LSKPGGGYGESASANLRQLGLTYSKAILTKVIAVLAAHSLQKVAIRTLEDELSPRQVSCLVRSYLNKLAA